MEDAVVVRMQDRFTERLRDMGLPEKDIPGRVEALMREVHGLAASDAAANEESREF